MQWHDASSTIRVLTSLEVKFKPNMCMCPLPCCAPGWCLGTHGGSCCGPSISPPLATSTWPRGPVSLPSWRVPNRSPDCFLPLLKALKCEGFLTLSDAHLNFGCLLLQQLWSVQQLCRCPVGCLWCEPQQRALIAMRWSCILWVHPHLFNVLLFDVIECTVDVILVIWF